jgi:hypothetical protein
MKIINFLWLGSLTLGCKSEPEPFNTKLAGYEIHFPVMAYKVDTTIYHRFRWAHQYGDSTESTKIVWLFDMYEDGAAPVYGLPDKRQAYGVNIYLKNKATQMDSVIRALEVQFGKTMLPVIITDIQGESFNNNLGYSCQLNTNTTLFIREATCNQGDSWCQYNTLRICIGYNLKKDQLERLATDAIKIHKSYD